MVGIDGVAPPPVLRPLAIDHDAELDPGVAAPCGELAPGASCEQHIVLGDASLVPIDVGADLNADGKVSFFDLVLLLEAWGTVCEPGAPCPIDLDGDGVVSLPDLVVVFAHRGPCEARPGRPSVGGTGPRGSVGPRPQPS